MDIQKPDPTDRRRGKTGSFQPYSTWLAYPAHQELGYRLIDPVRPLLVHLVEHGARFEQIKAAWDGQTCWFHELDRGSDPQISGSQPISSVNPASPQNIGSPIN